jgi:hypothetical protein
LLGDDGSQFTGVVEIQVFSQKTVLGSTSAFHLSFQLPRLIGLRRVRKERRGEEGEGREERGEGEEGRRGEG